MLDSAARMAEFPHLRNAPITEAVIDFRVEPDSAVTVEELIQSLASRNNLGYVQKGVLVRSEFGFSLKIEAEPQVAHGGRATTIGVRLHSPDDKYVAQLSVEGFTLSRLEPYETWENLVGEARKVWAGYLECLGPGHMTRIATRYINNLRLPFSSPPEQFLKLLPVLPPGLPDALSEFLQRYVLHDATSQATVIVMEALERTVPTKPLPVILDIDAFRSVRIPTNDSHVWEYLTQLRDLKNRIFYGCLTPAGVELYQHDRLDA